MLELRRTPQLVSEISLLEKNCAIVGMLHAAIPANISISLFHVSVMLGVDCEKSSYAQSNMYATFQVASFETDRNWMR